MRRQLRSFALISLLAACATDAPTGGGAAATSPPAIGPWTASPGPDLPIATANNAVAAALVDGEPRIFSFLGLGVGRDYAAITRRAFVLDVAAARWEPLPDVPGPVGRLAATAQAIGSRVFLFGGYSVAADGRETTSPATDIYLTNGGVTHAAPTRRCRSTTPSPACGAIG